MCGTEYLCGSDRTSGCGVEREGEEEAGRCQR